MFELEDYSSGIHEGFLSKYADAAGPTLDFYVSDSMQDMLDVDIRAEIANVVGGSSEFTSSFDHALEAVSAINNNANHNIMNASTSSAGNSGAGSFLSNSAWHASPTAKWMGSSSWSSDYLADLGACVNPISVMPLISSSIMQNSPRINLNSSASSPPPASPIADRDPTKSHLTFSPAQMKISAGSMRREQVHAHIPKQIVTISSSVTGSTTAPATMATNSALQRKNAAAVDAVKKDLASELRRVHNSEESKKNGLLSGNTATNTIKLAPGIGGLTFANSATYNKLKQQNGVKSPQGAPVTANGTIVLKRDRDSSPLHNMATLNVVGNGGAITKRNLVQPMNSYTPKSIASAAHSPHMQNSVNANCSIGSPASSSSSLSSASSGNASPYHGSFSSNGGLTPLSSTSNLVNIANNTNVSGVAVKPLHQKIKSTPVEPEYPKPAYSYSCLIAMALKNSRSGSLPVSEIYSFMCEHFPYFKNAPSGWKNSVRHNLSLNKCFEKIEKPASNGNARKGCLWAMNPERITKMDEEVQKWSRKDPSAIRNAMVFPENLEALERGEMKHGSADSDVELDSQSEIEEASDLEEHEFDDTLVDNMLVEEDDEEGGSIDEEEVMQNVIGSQQDMNNRVGIDHDLMLAQKQGDFDIEIDEMYDEIEIEDDKEAVRMAIRQADIIEINPADLNGGYQSPKRARLDINYSIGAAGELEKRILPQQQNFKKVIVQPAQTLLQTQEHPQFVVQAIHSPQQFQPFNTFAQQNRRKMQLVSRIV